MDEYAEEIWEERLRFDIDTNKIYDRKSLLKELNKLLSHAPENKKAAVKNLIKFAESLFSSASLEKTAIRNILKLTNLRKLRQLSRRKPRKIRKTAIKRIASILKYQQKSQSARTAKVTGTLKSAAKTYARTPAKKYTKSQTLFIRQNTSNPDNRQLAINFYKRFNIPITADAIKAKKLRLKGTKN